MTIKTNNVQVGTNAVTPDHNIVLAADAATGDLVINKGTHDGALTEIQRIRNDGSGMSYMPAGVGVVATTVQGKLRESVSVLDFYANGVSGVAVDPTGVIDSTLGIQAAIDYVSPSPPSSPFAGTVYFPRGAYLITQPLNLTGDNGLTSRRGVRLLGEVAGSGDYVYGTKIIGATNGKAIIEIIDNDNFQMENLTLTNAATNPSTVGIYQARRTGGTSPSQWAGNCNFKNVTITFSNDNTTQNNNFGTIGIINVAGEETTYERCEVWANLPLAISWANNLQKSVNSMAPSTYDNFSYSPVWASVGDITTGFSNTVFRTIACRFIAKGYNAPIVLLQEVGSYFSYGDFTQKRPSTTATDSFNGVGYEFWNAFQVTIDATSEGVITPLLFHRAAQSLDINIRGAAVGPGVAVGVICFAPDASSYPFNDAKIVLNFTGTLPNGLISYIAPSGVGAQEPAQVTLNNCQFRVNQTKALSTVDPKIIYNSYNVDYGFSDTSYRSDNRYLRIPLSGKSIGTPSTATALFRLTLPQSIAGSSGFSATVTAHLHISNAEDESAGTPSSMAVKAVWQVVRDAPPTTMLITSQTSDILTASSNAAGNHITNISLTQSPTGTAETELRIATVQSGANNAAAYVSGYLEIIYAGGYSRAPSFVLL
jgi:hypothetical protein